MRLSLLLSLFLVGCSTASTVSSQSETREPLPLSALAGGWVGTLTYADYSDDATSVTLTVAATVTPYRTDGIAFSATIFEPDGSPAGRSSSSLLPTADGITTEEGDWTILSQSADGGSFALTMQQSSEDNNRPATIRREIAFDGATYTDRKTVRYAGTGTFFERNIIRVARR